MTNFDPAETPENQENESATRNLLSVARQGDQEALGSLVERFRKYLLLIANAELDRDLQGKFGASDIVQQSMLQAQQHFDQFRGDSPQELQAWLRKILINDLRKAHRTFATQKRKSNQEVSLQDHSSVERGLLDQHLTPSTQAMRRERSLTLTSALAKLSDDHRRVIVLRNFEQQSFEQIAQQLGRTADASRKLWARAIQALQQSIEQLAPELLTGIHQMNEERDA